jgi:putative addiction module killer protein
VEAKPREIRHAYAANGEAPFEKWVNNIKGQQIYRRVLQRLGRAEDGNLGDHCSVGDGVWELRFFDPQGHRIYYGEDKDDGKDLIILLTGGNKGTQVADIAAAKKLWNYYNA